jgi:hypothetical protein
MAIIQAPEHGNRRPPRARAGHGPCRLFRLPVLWRPSPEGTLPEGRHGQACGRGCVWPERLRAGPEEGNHPADCTGVRLAKVVMARRTYAFRTRSPQGVGHAGPSKDGQEGAGKAECQDGQNIPEVGTPTDTAPGRGGSGKLVCGHGHAILSSRVGGTEVAPHGRSDRTGLDPEGIPLGQQRRGRASPACLCKGRRAASGNSRTTAADGGRSGQSLKGQAAPATTLSLEIIVTRLISPGNPCHVTRALLKRKAAIERRCRRGQRRLERRRKANVG